MIEPREIHVFECPDCGERFRRYEYCEEHIKEEHESSKEPEKFVAGKSTGNVKKRL